MDWIKTSDRLPDVSKYEIHWLDAAVSDKNRVKPRESFSLEPCWFVVEWERKHAIQFGKGKNKQIKEVLYRRSRSVEKGFFDGEFFIVDLFPRSRYRIESDFNSIGQKYKVAYWMPREVPPFPEPPDDGFVPYGVDDYIKELKANADTPEK